MDGVETIPLHRRERTGAFLAEEIEEPVHRCEWAPEFMRNDAHELGARTLDPARRRHIVKNTQPVRYIPDDDRRLRHFEIARVIRGDMPAPGADGIPYHGDWCTSIPVRFERGDRLREADIR